MMNGAEYYNAILVYQLTRAMGKAMLQNSKGAAKISYSRFEKRRSDIVFIMRLCFIIYNKSV